jgi:hypothetical protein
VECLNCSIIDVMIEQDASDYKLDEEMMAQKTLRLSMQVKLCSLCPVSSADGDVPVVRERESSWS